MKQEIKNNVDHIYGEHNGRVMLTVSNQMIQTTYQSF